MDVIGTAQTLFDLGIRVANFINDLRHAQDDFLALRAEANCLRICINSLGAESCQDALYHYISHKQRKDLELIVENTLINMEDLNKFLGSYKVLVEREAKRIARRERKRDKWKRFMKKAWATYKVAVTDPQPFRDKLALPAASINIFLSSITHSALANVGSLISLPGSMPSLGNCPCITQDPASSATGLVTAGWEVIGAKVAFKRLRSTGRSHLTKDLEDEIVRYAAHLLKGGQPFDTKNDKSRSRSKSRSRIELEKDRGSGMFIVRRKKSFVRRTSPRMSLVDDEPRLLRERTPIRLALPAPSPTRREAASPSTPIIVDATPNFEVSDDEDLLSSQESITPPVHASSSRARRRASAAAEEAEKKSKERYATGSRPHRYRPSDDIDDIDDIKTYRRNCREQVQHEIVTEQGEAAEETRRGSERRRSERRQYHDPTEVTLEDGVKIKINVNPKYDESDSSDDEDIMEVLSEQYGLTIERLYLPRPTIDNGTVAPVVPSPLVEPDEEADDDLEEKTILPKRGARLQTETSFYESSRPLKRPRYDSNNSRYGGSYPRHSASYQRYSGDNDSPYRTSRRHEFTHQPRRSYQSYTYDDDDDDPNNPEPYERFQSRYDRPTTMPEVVVEHHDDSDTGQPHKGILKSPGGGARERRDQNLGRSKRRSASYGGQGHEQEYPTRIIRKRSYGGESDQYLMRGARSEAGSHRSQNSDNDDDDDDNGHLQLRHSRS